MTILHYEDFNVRLARLRSVQGQEVFNVWVEGKCPAGFMHPSDEAELAWKPQDLWDDPTTVYGGLAGAPEELRVEERDLRALGAKLAELALPIGPVRTLFLESLKLVQQQEKGLRLRLHLDVIELARLPWEYLMLPSLQGGASATDFLALREEVSIVRTDTVESMANDLPARDHFRFVGVLSAPDVAALSLSELDLTLDRGAVDNAIELVNKATKDPILTSSWVTTPATRGALRAELGTMDSIDIFHFGGHGFFDMATREGALLFEGDDNKPDKYGADEVAVMLRRSGVRLAFLGACQSSKGSGRNMWSGVAQALSRQRIPAVIGTQFELVDAVAGTLMFEVYSNLFRGMSIDQALARARIAMMTDKGIEARDWGVITLHLHDETGVLFPLPEGDSDDPNTQALVNIAASLQALEDRGVTGSLIGQVTGGEVTINQAFEAIAVKAGVINGNVEVNQTEIQVYALTQASRASFGDPMLSPDAPPYPGPVPFKFSQRGFFCGRESLATEINRASEANQVVVLHGPPAAGKTSLINCRLVPHVIERGAFAVRIEDYGDPARVLASALSGAGEALSYNVADVGFAEQITSFTSQAEGPLVLILDQFERLFDLPDGQRLTSMETLGPLLADPIEGLRIVLSISDRDEGGLAKLDAFSGVAPGLLSKTILVPPMTTDEAISALKDPAVRHPRFTFHSDALIATIVTDLDFLSNDKPERIEPRDLQIVASALFDAAAKTDLGVVTEEVYRGASEIVALHLANSLQLRYSDDRELADTILRELSRVGSQLWVAASEIQAEGTSPDLVRELLDEMLTDGLVVRRMSDPYEYTLANSAVRDAVEIYSGTAGDRQAVDTLQGVWHGWLTSRRLADVGQLASLAESSYRTPDTAINVLLLRSAVAARAPTAPWLTELANNAAIAELQAAPTAPPVGSAFFPLFGFAELGSTKTEGGALARAAISSDDPIAADTAVLALSTIDGYPAEVDDALRHVDAKRERRRRRARAWSALLEAGSDSSMIQDLAREDRIAIWTGRVGRRFGAQNSEVGWLTIWSAVGAGFAYGAFRFLSSFWTTTPLGIDFSVNFFWAFLLAVGASGAALFAHFALLKPSALKVVACGAVGFGLAHAIVGVLNGDNPWTLRWASGFAFMAGAGIGAMLIDPGSSWPWHRWTTALVGNALVFAVAHAIIQNYAAPISPNGPVREAMQVVRNFSFYAAQLPQYIDSASGWSTQRYQMLSVADAALAGASLAWGARAGARIRHRSVST